MSSYRQEMSTIGNRRSTHNYTWQEATHTRHDGAGESCGVENRFVPQQRFSNSVEHDLGLPCYSTLLATRKIERMATPQRHMDDAGVEPVDG